MSRKRTNPKKGSLACPVCGKGGFSASGPLKAHKKAIHPDAPDTDKDTYQLIYNVQKAETTGFQQAVCPACKQPTVIYVKDDGTIASSSEMPRPPSSSSQPKKSPVKRGAHPLYIRERYKMRWNKEESRWKRTVAMSGTHGRSAPEMPWHETGIEERWLLNDCHGIEYMKPPIEAGKVTRWWQLHHRWRVTRRATRYASDHWQWLQDQSYVPRVVMQRAFKEVPGSEAFPFREICETFLGGKLGRGAGYVQKYFTNTFSYLFSMVAYEKMKGIHDWERIELYGCELEQLETEYFRQRPGLEFWFGVVTALGIEIYVPESCYMLYAQDIRRDEMGNQKLVNYPGYMSYGYMSPSMEEAKAMNHPLGVDPIEENVIGSWDDYEYIDHTYAMNDGMARRVQRHDMSNFVKENEALNKWVDALPAE